MHSHCSVYRAHHHFEEHTGEVQVHVQAPDLPALYREAGVALAELMAPGAPAATQGPAEEIELRARDPAALLVEWVDELIYRVDTSGKVYTDLRIDHADRISLHAVVRGCRPRAFKTAVKAATFHQLAVEENEEGYSARLVLDV